MNRCTVSRCKHKVVLSLSSLLLPLLGLSASLLLVFLESCERNNKVKPGRTALCPEAQCQLLLPQRWSIHRHGEKVDANEDSLPTSAVWMLPLSACIIWSLTSTPIKNIKWNGNDLVWIFHYCSSKGSTFTPVLGISKSNYFWCRLFKCNAWSAIHSTTISHFCSLIAGIWLASSSKTFYS